MADYQSGSAIRFKTSKVSIHHGDFTNEIIDWQGRIKGEVISQGDKTLIPVWCDRVGKDSTAIYVDERNVIPA